MPSAAIRLASSWCASTSNCLPAAASTAGAVESASSIASSTRASTSASASSPARTAFMSWRTESSPGTGISKVEPAATPATWSLEPPQSVTMAPSNPHSPRRMSLSRWGFSLA